MTQPASGSPSEPAKDPPIAGRVGVFVGGAVGAIAGSRAGEALSKFTGAANESSGLGLGADSKAVELPKHYSWEELQALSKPGSDRSPQR